MPENTNEKYVGSPDLLNNRGWKSYIHRYQYGIKTNIASCRYFNSDGCLVKKEDYTYCRSAGLVMDGGIKMEAKLLFLFIRIRMILLIRSSFPGHLFSNI